MNSISLIWSHKQRVAAGCGLAAVACLLAGCPRTGGAGNTGQGPTTTTGVPAADPTAAAVAMAKAFATQRDTFQKQLAEARDNTSRAAAHVGLGQTWLGQGKNKEARAEFDAALKHQDADPRVLVDALTNMGTTYMNESKFDAARAEFNKALALKNIKPADLGRVYSNLANAYMAQRRYAEARAQYQKILTIPGVSKDDAALARLTNASTYFYAGDYPAAQVALEKLAAPGQVPPLFLSQYYNQLGLTYQREKNYDKAIAEFAKLETAGTEQDKAGMTRQSHQAKGLCYLEAKQFARAREEFNLLLNDKDVQGPQLVSIHQRMAESYIGENNMTAARTEYQKALDVPGIDEGMKKVVTSLLANLDNANKAPVSKAPASKAPVSKAPASKAPGKPK